MVTIFDNCQKVISHLYVQAQKWKGKIHPISYFCHMVIVTIPVFYCIRKHLTCSEKSENVFLHLVTPNSLYAQ